MKKLLITTAVLLAMTAPAMALDFGNNMSLDNTITAEYATQAELFTASYEAQLNYKINAEINIYAATEIDLQNIDFSGLDIGVDYNPTALQMVNLNAEAQFDSDLTFSEFVISAEVKF